MAKQIDKHVGRKIRQLRHARGMTQSDLGNAIGVRFQQLQKYESAANRVSASRLAMIAQTLKVPVAEFFPRELSKIPATDNLFEQADVRDMVRLYGQAPEVVKDAVRALLRAVVHES